MGDQNNRITLKLLELMQKTGYPIVQHNGQRKTGPPPEWTGAPPLKGCEVFIGKLPRDVFEDELMPLFSSVGKIYEMRLMMDFSGSNRGYAFVTYATRTQAAAAVKQLNGYEIQPRRHIGVVKSVDNCRLFIGNIPKTKTQGELLQELSKHVTGLVDVILYKNSFDRNLNRGFAFVEFTSHKAAAMARRELVPGCIKLWDQEVLVDWAEPEPDIDDEQMKKHLDKKEYANGSPKDEGIGSAYAGDSPCISPMDLKPAYPYTAAPQSNYALAPAKLESMCKRYLWSPPVYNYQKYVDPAGVELWVCSVELPQVGLPLLTIPQRVGPLIGRACYSILQANVEAADIALQTLKMLRVDLIQQSAPAPPVYSPMPAVQNCVRLPYDYPQMYPQMQQVLPLTIPTGWRTF